MIEKFIDFEASSNVESIKKAKKFFNDKNTFLLSVFKIGEKIFMLLLITALLGLGFREPVYAAKTRRLARQERMPVAPASYTGIASYYSRAGCVGCSKTLTMANGQALDDSGLTVAFNRAKLNTFVTVTNLKTGQSVRAKVSDTGGFERHGRIIDLTMATRDAIGCGHLCKVRVDL